MVFSAKGVMMSHSIGLSAESRKLHLETLAYAKRRSEDEYVKIVNNRDVSQRRLDRFMTDLGVNVFVVGHSHYRSGDVEENGKLATICSSNKRSEEAGHYMENEFRWERLTGKGVKEGRQGEAAAYYAMFDEKTVTQINRKINLCLVDQITSLRKGGLI